MRNKITLLTIIALGLLMTACGTIKKASSQTTSTTNPPTSTTTTTAATDPLQSILATLGDWQTMQTGGNISLKGGSNFSSSIQVRMVRDQAIFISLRPMLGIEVGRLLITADSLYAVDKVHKRYIAEKVSVLTAGIPVTVSDVQDMFLGRPFLIGKGTLSKTLEAMVTTSDKGGSLTVTANEQYKGYGYAFAFDKSSHIVSLDIMPQGSTTAAYQARYNDVRGTQAGNIAHGIKVSASAEKRKIDFTLTYKNIDWNGNVKIDRSIPGNYSRMRASDLFSLFAN